MIRLVTGSAALVLFSSYFVLAAPVQAPPKSDPYFGKKAQHRIVLLAGKETPQPAEVSLAVNPANPDQLAAVAHTTRGSLYCLSRDGGKSWKNALLANESGRRQGDDLLVFAAGGKLYHACIRFNGIRQNRPPRADSGIFVASTDDLEHWHSAVSVVDHFNSVAPFEDKPWLACDSMVDSPNRGNLYVCWTRFDVYGSADPAHKSHIFFSRSTNGGKNFSPSWRISDKPGDCRDSSNTVMGGMPAVGPRGEVYVVWSGPEGIVFDQSTDGGMNFGKDQVILKNPPGWDIPVAGLMRHNGLPVISVDTGSGSLRGTIYLTWIDKRHGDADVFCVASRDGGKTWSEPLRVNNDEVGNGKEQLFHWSALDPVDGSLNVIFYDRRGRDGTKTGLTLARSNDGARTFVNYPLDQEPFETFKETFFGDYIAVAAHQGRVAAVYSHFTGRRDLALSAALFQFKPGTQESLP